MHTVSQWWYLILAHADEVLQAELLVSHGVVGIGVQHDERKGQQVGAIGCLEGIWVVLAVPLSKPLHNAINLLGLTCINAGESASRPLRDCDKGPTEAATG